MPETGTSDKGFCLSLPFAKIDKARREVWGCATSETLDQQGERVSYDASKEAFLKWADDFNKATGGESLGNIREMHGSTVVGKAIAVVPNDKKRHVWLGVKLSESQDGQNAWTKIQEHVLNGFSIGAPTAKREIKFSKSGEPERWVTGYKVSETSLVDNPADPDSFFAEIKMCKGMLSPIDADAPRGEDVRKYNESHESAGSPEGGQFAPGEGGGGGGSGEGGGEKPSDTSAAAGEGGKDKELLALHHSRRAMRFNNASRRALSEAIRRLKAGDQEGSARQRAISDENEAKYKEEEKLVHQYGGWRKMVSGDDLIKISYEENSMDAKLLLKQADEIAKTASTIITAQHKPGQATAAGAQVPQTPALASPDAAPAPAKSAAANTGKPGGVQDLPETPVSPPPTQGKDAAAPTVTESAAEAAAEHEAMGKPPPPKDAACKCDKCGQVMVPPIPQAVKTVNSDELKKAFESNIDGMQKAMLAKVDALASTVGALEKRLAVVEATPTSGGPMRTELPPGIVPVSKGGPANGGDEATMQILEKAAGLIADPFVRDQVNRQAGMLAVKKAMFGPAR